jgi:hypothetical protein
VTQKYKKELLWFESVARKLALKIVREWHPSVLFAQDVFASVIELLACVAHSILTTRIA